MNFIELMAYRKQHKHKDTIEQILSLTELSHLDKIMIVTMEDSLSMLNLNYIYIATKTNFANFYQLVLILFLLILVLYQFQAHFQIKSLSFHILIS